MISMEQFKIVVRDKKKMTSFNVRIIRMTLFLKGQL